ncbi:MAG: NADH:flavin oxidoreductase/NADH oxidase family protein [Pseudomonadota bacterium]
MGDQILAQPLTLPCGVVLKNRLAKSAMSDSLGDGAGNPTSHQARMYERWAEGGLALSIIGEVQTDPRALEKPGNLVLATDSDKTGFAALMKGAVRDGAHLWAQLGHAGALSYAPVGRPVGPSALDVPGLRCGALEEDEIAQFPALIAQGAGRAQNLGFTGVQIHAAHGFLLSQFLSPLFNKRTDRWGGALENRARLLLETIEAVRARVGPRFPIAVKLNASDMLDGGLSEEDSLQIVAMLNALSVDLIEISAGTYFPGAKAASDGRADGPYFIDFARKAREKTDIPLMAAGGFKRREQALAALSEKTLDMVALARPVVLEPNLPSIWMSDTPRDPVFPRFASTQPGGVTAWYTLRITAMSEDREENFAMDADTALEVYDKRDAEREALWAARFGKADASSDAASDQATS